MPPLSWPFFMGNPWHAERRALVRRPAPFQEREMRALWKGHRRTPHVLFCELPAGTFLQQPSRKMSELRREGGEKTEILFFHLQTGSPTKRKTLVSYAYGRMTTGRETTQEIDRMKTKPRETVDTSSPHELRVCKECGTKFYGSHLARWCSNACRQRAYRKRRKASHGNRN